MPSKLCILGDLAKTGLGTSTLIALAPLVPIIPLAIDLILLDVLECRTLFYTMAGTGLLNFWVTCLSTV